MDDNYPVTYTYVDGEYKIYTATEKVGKHAIFSDTFTYDGNKAVHYINGIKKAEEQYSGKIEQPIDNTHIAIGVNPMEGYEPNGGYADIEAYGVRIYNRALTEEEVEINSKTDERRYRKEEIIPVYTEEQLLKMGTGESVYVEEENKTYTYDTGLRYEYKNTIEMQSDYTDTLNKISNGQIFIKLNDNYIKSNDNYYTYKSQYTIAENKYGYIKSNLQLLLDGIDNTGNGHSTTTNTWKDLSGKNRNGTLKNMTASSAWTSEGLKFDGTDDYVPIAEMNYSNITMEAVVDSEVQSAAQDIVSNVQTGGYRLKLTSANRPVIEVYITEQKIYEATYFSQCTEYSMAIENVRYSFLGAYNGKRIITRARNAYEYKDVEGTIGTPLNSTYIVLGGNPGGAVATSEWFKGTIYSIRIYDRMLTDEEMSVNFLNDKLRYNV